MKINDLLYYTINTILIWVEGFIPQIAVSLFLAVLFTDFRLNMKFQRFWKTVIYMVDAEEAPDKEAETILHTKLAHLLEQYPSAESLMEQLQKQDAFFKDYSSYFQIDSGEANEDAMMNHNIPFQTLYQSFVSRAFAQTQKGYREIGFREVQDLYASIPYLVNSHREALASELLSKWIENVYTMGYANHNFFVVGKEPGMCSDDQLWLIPAVEQYIESTGDISYLDKEFPTADGGRRSLVDMLSCSP